MKPIKTITLEPGAYCQVEEVWTYEELLRLYDCKELVYQLVRRCQAFEQVIANLGVAQPDLAAWLLEAAEEIETAEDAKDYDNETPERFIDDN